MDHPPRGGALSGSLVPDGLDATLVLVRHGESAFIAEGRFQGQMETPLTDRGHRQAALAADRLAHPHAAPALPVPDGPPLEIVHSPLARTRATAEAIGAAMVTAAGAPTGSDRAVMGAGTIPLRPDPGFLEIAQGSWEGLHRDEIARRFPSELATWRRRPTEGWAPGGEPLAAVAERVRPALARLLAGLAAAGVPGTRDRDQVAGYGDPVLLQPWSVLVGHDGVFKVTLLTLFDLPLERFWMWSMDLCAMSVVEFRAGQPVVRAFNLTGHLAPLLDEAALAAQERRSRSGAL